LRLEKINPKDGSLFSHKKSVRKESQRVIGEKETNRKNEREKKGF